MDLQETVSLFWILTFCVPLSVLSFFCIRCRTNSPSRIHDTFNRNITRNSFRPSVPPTNVSSFTVIRQTNYQTTMIQNFLVSPQPSNSRRSSLLITKDSETEIEPNYENTEDKDSSDDELDNKNYIEVIPDNLVRTVRVLENDRSSTGTIGEDYENLKENPSSDTNDGSSNYINIDPLEELMDEADQDENFDEDGSDYVNSSKCALRH